MQEMQLGLVLTRHAQGVLHHFLRGFRKIHARHDAPKRSRVGLFDEQDLGGGFAEALRGQRARAVRQQRVAGDAEDEQVGVAGPAFLKQQVERRAVHHLAAVSGGCAGFFRPVGQPPDGVFAVDSPQLVEFGRELVRELSSADESMT